MERPNANYFSNKHRTSAYIRVAGRRKRTCPKSFGYFYPADVNDDWKRLEQENMRAEMFTLRRVQKI